LPNAIRRPWSFTGTVYCSVGKAFLVLDRLWRVLASPRSQGKLSALLRRSGLGCEAIACFFDPREFRTTKRLRPELPSIEHRQGRATGLRVSRGACKRPPDQQKRIAYKTSDLPEGCNPCARARRAYNEAIEGKIRVPKGMGDAAGDMPEMGHDQNHDAIIGYSPTRYKKLPIRGGVPRSSEEEKNSSFSRTIWR
jgi:hypothetical protein